MWKKAGICAAALILCLGTLFGCGLFKEQSTKYEEVSTLAELKEKAKNNVGIKLTADIDCDYETVEGFAVKAFDGGGHTIKNATIVNSGTGHVAFLQGDIELIKDVTFSKITVTAGSAYDAAVVCAKAQRIENVHVADSSVTADQKTGGSSATRKYYECLLGGIAVEAQETENCSVKNTTFSLEGIESSEAMIQNRENLYVGALAATGNSIKNCHTDGCEMTVKSGYIDNEPYAGGLVARSKGPIENSYAMRNKLKVTATWRSKNQYSDRYETSCAYAGGLAASVAACQIRYCYAAENTFDINCSGDIYAGGLLGTTNGDAGTITQSYAIDNTFSASGYIAGNESGVSRCMGGLAGSTIGATVTSVFSHGNTISDTQTVNHAEDVTVGGLIALPFDTKVSYCAAANTLEGARTFAFGALSDRTLQSNWYTDDSDDPEHLLADPDWLGEGLKERLRLLGNWTFDEESLPKLTFAAA